MAIDPYDLKSTDPGLMAPRYTEQYKKSFSKTGMVDFDENKTEYRYGEGGKDLDHNIKSWGEMSIEELQDTYDQAVSNKGFFDAVNSKLGKSTVSTVGDIIGAFAGTTAPLGMAASTFFGAAGWINDMSMEGALAELGKRTDPLDNISNGWSYSAPSITGAPVDLSSTVPSFNQSGWSSGGDLSFDNDVSFGGPGSVDLSGTPTSFDGPAGIGLGLDSFSGGERGGGGGSGGYGGHSTGGDPAGGHPGGADHGMGDNTYG